MASSSTAVPVALPPVAAPIDNIVWTAPPRRGMVPQPMSQADDYEESPIIDPGDRIPLTDAEMAPRPSSVPTSRGGTSRGAGTQAPSRALLADLFCAGGGGGGAESEQADPAARLPPQQPSSSRARQASVPATANRITGSGASTLRLRPGAVIQLRLRSMPNEMATPTPGGSGERGSEVGRLK